MGCNACWLKTPGICSIRDGYEEVLKAYLECDAAVFLAGTALNFVDHRMKHVIDRLLPLATMYIHIADGDYLNHWLDRVVLHLGGSSLGAFPIHQAKEVLSCI